MKLGHLRLLPFLAVSCAPYAPAWPVNSSGYPEGTSYQWGEGLDYTGNGQKYCKYLHGQVAPQAIKNAGWGWTLVTLGTAALATSAITAATTGNAIQPEEQGVIVGMPFLSTAAAAGAVALFSRADAASVAAGDIALGGTFDDSKEARDHCLKAYQSWANSRPEASPDLSGEKNDPGTSDK